jgi:hypothetical protein
LKARVVQPRHASSRSIPTVLKIAGILAASAFAAFCVWFAGYDYVWSVATVIVFGSVGVALGMLKFEEQLPWDPHGRETPRGVGLALPMMEQSLAACDRLARPAFTRPIQTVLSNERDERLARGTIVRQVRAILVTELRARGVSPANQTDERVIALLGHDALAVLQANDDNPVTSAVISNCLDAVERLATSSLPTQ